VSQVFGTQFSEGSVGKAFCQFISWWSIISVLPDFNYSVDSLPQPSNLCADPRGGKLRAWLSLSRMFQCDYPAMLPLIDYFFAAPTRRQSRWSADVFMFFRDIFRCVTADVVRSMMINLEVKSLHCQIDKVHRWTLLHFIEWGFKILMNLPLKFS
jgi:hypothetical protein